MNKAENYGQFVEALKTFTCPGQNIIYSDVEDNSSELSESEYYEYSDET